MLEQIEALEDHSYFRTLPSHDSIGLAKESTGRFTVANELAVNVNATPINPFEVIDAAEQCALAGAACAYENHDFTRSDLKGDISQGVHHAEVLLHPDGLNHDARRQPSPARAEGYPIKPAAHRTIPAWGWLWNNA